MSNFLAGLSEFAALYPALIYLIIFFGSFIQGESTILFSVFLATDGAIAWPNYLLIMFAGVILNEIGVYHLAGYLRGTAFGEKLHRKIPYYHAIEHEIQKNSLKIILVSKAILGASFLIIFLSGWIKTKFKFFFRHIIIAATAWIAVFNVIAYILMNRLSHAETDQIFKQIELIIAGLAVLLVVFKLWIRKLFKKKLSAGETAEQELQEKLQKTSSPPPDT